MKLIKVPLDLDIKWRFPNFRQEICFEGGVLLVAERDGKFYSILDERTMRDFLGAEDQDIVDQLLKVYEFNTEEERERFLQRYRRKTGKK